MHYRAAWMFGCMAVVASAQDGVPAQPKRSLAEGIVRHLLESERFEPPRLESGLELGAGEGSLVLMIRHADGTLELREIERGPGQHGAAPEKARIDVPVEIEEGAEGAEPGAAGPVKVRLRRTGDDVSLATEAEPKLFAGAAVDRARLKPAMQKLFAATRGTKGEGQLLLEMAPDVLLQDVLTTCEVARDAGFSGAMWSGSGGGGIRAEDRELLAALPSKFDWRVERKGPGGVQPVCDGELLVLLDGPTRWRDFVPLYLQCARVGIWRIGFVGQKDVRTRFKLPANLPFDRGM